MSNLRTELLENGFCIIRNAVPPPELERLRGVFKGLLHRQREIWRRERRPEDPPEAGAGPRRGWSFDSLGVPGPSLLAGLECARSCSS